MGNKNYYGSNLNSGPHTSGIPAIDNQNCNNPLLTTSDIIDDMHASQDKADSRGDNRSFSPSERRNKALEKQLEHVRRMIGNQSEEMKVVPDLKLRLIE